MAARRHIRISKRTCRVIPLFPRSPHICFAWIYLPRILQISKRSFCKAMSAAALRLLHDSCVVGETCIFWEANNFRANGDIRGAMNWKRFWSAACVPSANESKCSKTVLCPNSNGLLLTRTSSVWSVLATTKNLPLECRYVVFGQLASCSVICRTYGVTGSLKVVKFCTSAHSNVRECSAKKCLSWLTISGGNH